VRLRRSTDRSDLAETYQPRLWAVLIVLGLLALYLVAFVVENNKEISVHFVLGTARVSLIWVILFSVLIGLLGGLMLSQLYRRRRRRRSAPPTA
jgi:uncharacterized integral membrane protein